MRYLTLVLFFNLFCFLACQHQPANQSQQTSHLVIVETACLMQGFLCVMQYFKDRSGLLWNLLMSCAKVQEGLFKLGFTYSINNSTIK